MKSLPPPVTLVTGPMRSGTSCVTGLLEQCGLSLGCNVRVLRDETPYNPKGHFEHDLLYTINERLVIEVPGDGWTIWHVPNADAMAHLAAQRKRYFQLFLRKFDGDLCKDPLFCLTLPAWEQHWPALRYVIFCLRHPLAVAQSMRERYLISLDQGLELWQTYTARFFNSPKRSQVFVFDFDAFLKSPGSSFSTLLAWLGRPLPQEKLQALIQNFFAAEHVHWSNCDPMLADLPVPVRELYSQVCARTGPL